MVSLIDAASYIVQEYDKEYKEHISEMKLHKLLYFAQRESLILKDEPLFDAVFYGWKYGPVLKEIRSLYPSVFYRFEMDPQSYRELKPVMDSVFLRYAGKDAWSLSRLTHGEYSWKQSRLGVNEYENSDNPMKLEDIKVDADRIKERRAMLS